MKSKKCNQFKTGRDNEQKKVTYTGASDVAIKILYRILELDKKNKTTNIYKEASLVQRWANALEKVIDVENYANLTEEHKIVVIEAIASDFHVKSKKYITNVVNFSCTKIQKTYIFEESGLPCFGISYNSFKNNSVYPKKPSTEYYSVQFPNYFYMGDLVLDIKRSLRQTKDKLHLILLAWSYDRNSFFAQSELPKEVVGIIGMNIVELDLIANANILIK